MTRGRVTGWAALSGAVAVMAGAYGAHGVVMPAADWLRTGAQYQMVHAAAALAVATRAPRVAGLWLSGAAVFAGTLYLMALGAPRWLGAVTPVGGLLMIGGWIALAWTAFQQSGPLETPP